MTIDIGGPLHSKWADFRIDVGSAVSKDKVCPIARFKNIGRQSSCIAAEDHSDQLMITKAVMAAVQMQSAMLMAHIAACVKGLPSAFTHFSTQMS